MTDLHALARGVVIDLRNSDMEINDHEVAIIESALQAVADQTREADAQIAESFACSVTVSWNHGKSIESISSADAVMRAKAIAAAIRASGAQV